MFNREQGVYADLEKNKLGKQSYKDQKKFSTVVFASALSFGVCILLSMNNSPTMEFLFVNISDMFSGKNVDDYELNIPYYTGLVLVVFLLWFSLFMKERKYISDEHTPLKEPIMSKLSKIIFTPLTSHMIPYRDQLYLQFKAGWFDSLDRKFFKQTHNVVDGYSRVSELNHLKKIFEIYTKDEKEEITQMFKSEEALLDLYKITEGYLTEKDKEKFDKTMELTKENFNDFRAFNEKDTVYFSIDFIIYKVEEESIKFREFLEKRMIRSRSKISRECSTYFTYLINDLKATEKLLSMDNLEHQNIAPEKMEKLKLKNAYYKKLIKENKYEQIELILQNKLVVYFKFILSRVILQKYTNIPAGTAVSKIADYTLRMITEVYDVKVLINIDKNKNDGTSESFNGDALVNLFLYTYNHYLYSRREKLLDEIDRAINVDFLSNTEDGMNTSNIISNTFNEMDTHAEENSESLNKFIKDRVLGKK